MTYKIPCRKQECIVGEIKNGQSRETGNIWYTRRRQRKQINVREYRRSNQKRTIQRNWQHRVHKTKINKTNKRQRIRKEQSKQDNLEKLATQGTQDEDKQNKKHNLIGVGHHYHQTNTNNVDMSPRIFYSTCSYIKTHVLYWEELG